MTAPLRVLLVEDNVELAEELVFHLQSDGFACHCVHSASALTAWLATDRCDVLVLDLGLPDADGLDIAKSLSNRPDLRIVMLTARAARQDRIDGFTSGADVYLTKPVDLDELSAVIRRTARRLRVEAVAYSLDLLGQRLLVDGGDSLRLTTLECAFLAYLAAAPDQTASRYDLEKALWGGSPTPSTAKRLDILVHRLRTKLLAILPPGIEPITTRWGQGYALAIPLVTAG